MRRLSPIVLVVDAERAARRLLRTCLTPEGYRVVELEAGADASAAVTRDPPDVIVLELALPDMDGVDLIRRLREWCRVPLIVLTERGLESDKISALDAGADDYVTKPFAVGEFLARLRVALRRPLRDADSRPLIRAGDVEIDLVRRSVHRAGQPIALTPTEYAVLRVLVQSGGRALTHADIIDEVWGPGRRSPEHLRVFIAQLRQKLGDHGRALPMIGTEPQIGYRWCAGG